MFMSSPADPVNRYPDEELFPTGILENISGRTLRGILTGNWAGIPERIIEEIPGGISGEIPRDILENFLGKIFQGKPAGIPALIPERIPIGLSKSLKEYQEESVKECRLAFLNEF